MTSRRNTLSNGSSSKSSSSNSNNNKHIASTSSSSSASSSKWKLVRPWQPPSGNNSNNAEASLEDGNGGHSHHNNDSDDDAGVDEEDMAEDSGSSIILARSSSNSMKRMHLEVVDVSSTSVSLSVFGQSSSSNTQQEHAHQQQYLDTSLGSTSSMTNQTTATRRSRAASTSSERILSQPPQPPNISIKLNSAAWPHVFHTDASFFDTESTASRSGQDDQSMSSSSILVWGLSPGQNYHIELGVFEDGVDEDDETAEAEDLSEVSDTEESVRAAASVRTLDATEPDVPPPPYSSHDPSSGSTTRNDAEASLRSMLEKLRMTVKQKESALQSSIASMRRANDKLTREDQRHRQRIHMLEDSTSRLREVAADEDAEHESIREQIEELEETERMTVTRLERRRRQQEEAERIGKEEADKEDAELAELKERLDKAVEKEEEVLAKKLKLERELLPTYNIQLATLEADLRRLVDDHRRRFPYQHHLPPHAFSTHLSHNPNNVGHMHANLAAHNTRGSGGGGGSGREKMQARAVQHQQASQQQQIQSQGQQHTQPQPQPQMHLLPKEQSKIPSVADSGRQAHRIPVESNLGEDTGMEAMSRQRSNSGLDERSQKAQFGSPELNSIGSGRPASIKADSSDNKQGDSSNTTRTGSRFAWSNPNSWASKVAGGSKSGSSGAGNAEKEA